MIAVGQYDPNLGRIRTHTDDFYDHRADVLDRIRVAREIEAREKKGKR